MRNKLLAPNIDNSNPSVYPNGRIKDNTGSGNGTPVNEFVYGDLHEMKDKLMRLYGIVPNDLPDNESNGFQLIDALRALASKNDFILDLTDSSGILQVPIKLGFMLQKESVLCLSGVNFTAQTQIKGIDNVTYTISILGSFKSGEYVRLIKTAMGVTLIREVDAVNLDLAVSEFNYLKKASQTQENTGTIDTVATTPLTNKTVFARRVNGVDSDDYLATTSQNGLLSKEDKAIIDSFTSIEKNYGTFSGSGFDDDPVGTNYAVTGNITAAQKTGNTGDGGIITCTFQNAMIDNNYQVNISIESLGSFESDNDIFPVIWKKISTTQIQIYIEFTGFATKSLKYHIEVKQR
jgi:hypothetical protein